jgi:predicted NAD/FAD-binding protein
MVPLVSAVWSTGPTLALSYPARYLFRFLEHHGMLAVTGSPRWRTVTGGSARYVDKTVKQLTAVHLSTPVRAVRRGPDSVTLWDDEGLRHEVDRVVIATHPNQALRILQDATTEEQAVLGAIGYSVNETVLHRDASLLPSSEAARSSWNYLVPGCSADHGTGAAPVVSYHMNRLHRLVDPAEDYVVTLNGGDLIDPATVIARMTYEHPVYTPESVSAQALLPRLTNTRTAFAGAYHGWGFHEDGCASGVAAAAAFGVDW